MSASKKRVLGALFLTIFIDLVGFSIIFPLFPAMLQYYLGQQGENSLIGNLHQWLVSITPEGSQQTFLVAVLFGGLLGTLFSLLQFITAPLWGAWSDRVGRRKVLRITIAGTAISYLVWGLSQSFEALILARILGGIMAGNLAVATAAVSDVTSAADRSKGMALVGIAFGLGFILGPAIGGYGYLLQAQLLESGATWLAWAPHPFVLPALAAFVLSLLNFAWVSRVFKDSLNQPANDATHSHKRSWFGFFGLQNPAVAHASRVYFIFIFAFAGMEFTLTFLAFERLFYEPQDMVRMFLFIGFILAFTQGFIVRRYAHSIGEIPLCISGLLCGLLGLVLLAAAYNPTLFYIGLALMGIGIGLSSPTLTALVSLYCGPREQGAYLGAFRSAGALGRAFGPLTAAVCFWQFGSDITYLAGAGILIIAALLAIFLPKPFIPPDAH
ncbi:MAG: MFS transporter [Verrucomicrobia bacterium]|nr:MFS transporter [Verrucomicrobiota bacterium]